MGRKIFWTGIVTMPFAIVQAIIACLILLICLSVAIGVGSYVRKISSALDDATLRFVTGIDIGSSMTTYFTFISAIILLIAAALVALSVLLCKGISQNKPGKILVYVTCGGIVTICRMSVLTKDNFRDFPDDKTVLYLGLYTLYLILLVVHVVNIKRARDQGAMLAALMAYTMAVSASSSSPTAPSADEDACFSCFVV